METGKHFYPLSLLCPYPKYIPTKGKNVFEDLLQYLVKVNKWKRFEHNSRKIAFV